MSFSFGIGEITMAVASTSALKQGFFISTHDRKLDCSRFERTVLKHRAANALYWLGGQVMMRGNLLF